MGARRPALELGDRGRPQDRATPDSTTRRFLDPPFGEPQGERVLPAEFVLREHEELLERHRAVPAGTRDRHARSVSASVRS